MKLTVSDLELYAIQCPDSVNFLVGQTVAGEQVILGVPGPFLVGAFFNPQGLFLRSEVRESENGNPQGLIRPGKVRGEMLTRLWTRLNTWKAELGFAPATVTVAKFQIPTLDLGLFPLPRYLHEALNNAPPEPDELYRRECLEEAEEWIRQGSFVLRWGNEYWIQKSGEVMAT